MIFTGDAVADAEAVVFDDGDVVDFAGLAVVAAVEAVEVDLLVDDDF